MLSERSKSLARAILSSISCIFPALDSLPVVKFATMAMSFSIKLSKEPDKLKKEAMPLNKPLELGIVIEEVIPPFRLCGIKVEEGLKA